MTLSNLVTIARRPAFAALALSLVALPTAAHAAAIDPWPSYDPQTTCSPTAKKGTLKLAAYLQKHYPGSGSYGISRACSSGGRSEHKEGRAFDWRVNVTSAKERAYAYDFIRRIRATDSAGHRAALARRMGVMYVIFNDAIYSSSHNFAARAYLSSSCSSRATCSATLRHRNHMHISLTRAGGWGRTSWYTGTSVSTGTTPTQPPPTDINHEDSNIPTTSLHRPVVLSVAPGGSARTGLAVRKGQTVKVSAYGVNRFGPGHQLVSDATCVWNDQTHRWANRPRTDVKDRYGDPELKVNGVAVFARSTCRGGQHVYSARIVQQRTTPIRVTLGGRDQHAGAVRVVLSRTTTTVSSLIPRAVAPAPAPAVQAPISGRSLAVRDDVTVHSSTGSWTDEVLEAGVEYQVTVSGTRRIARGVVTDGQCLAINDRWERQGSMDLFRPGATHGALYLGGVRFTGTAPSEDPTGCTLHTHTMRYTPLVSGRVALRVWDPTGAGDNDGSLTVRFDRVTPVPMPAGAPAETVRTGGGWSLGSETFTVAADDLDGRVSSLKLKAGKSAMLYVEGQVQVADGRSADASCVADGWRWITSLGLLSGQDVYDLSVDGQDVTWGASRTRQPTCDYRHKYSLHYTAQKNGPLRFALFDLEYGDNSGAYTIRIVRD
jgi:hypothetical protein